MSNQCNQCGSYAINHHHHGRDGSDPDLCDVCYWHTRNDQLQAELAALKAKAAGHLVTDGGRNQRYIGFFEGETPEQREERLAAAPSQQQSESVMVPRELLMELRDAANECKNLSLRKYRTDFFEGLTKSADALLGGEHEYLHTHKTEAEKALQKESRHDA